MRAAILRFYERMRRRIAPNVRYAQLEYLDVVRAFVSTGCTWLDAGCGHQMFDDWMLDQERELTGRARVVVGIDRNAEGLMKHQTIGHRVIGDIESMPFPGETFDIVTANMVIEHVARPPVLLAEVRRLLRPKGLFIFHTPNRHSLFTRTARLMPQWVKNTAVLILEGRSAEDVFPTHYRLNGAEAIRCAAEQAGFRVAQLRQVNTAAALAGLGPVAAVELLYLRLLERPRFSHLRSNIVAVLQRN
jgi:ubiquinone/menaquinone biosynthesis C-methylase UbiE